MHRYVALRKKLLGLEELHMYDVYTSVVKGVAVQRRSKIVHRMINQIRALFFIRCFLQQIMRQQSLIASGSNLRTRHLSRLGRSTAVI